MPNPDLNEIRREARRDRGDAESSSNRDRSDNTGSSSRGRADIGRGWWKIVVGAIVLVLVVYTVSQAGSSGSEAGQESTDEKVSGEAGKLKAGPKANPDRFRVQGGRIVIFDVLANDHHTNGDELRIKAVEKGSTFMGFDTNIMDDQRIEFMPSLGSYIASSSEVEFWYKITDSQGATDKTKVRVQMR
jgi:hypothetical protein